MSPSGPPPTDGAGVSRLALFDVLLAVAALALVAAGFWQWAEHGAPDWQPVSVLASAVVYKGGLRYGLPRGTDEVVAGWALVHLVSEPVAMDVLLERIGPDGRGPGDRLRRALTEVGPPPGLLRQAVDRGGSRS